MACQLHLEVRETPTEAQMMALRNMANNKREKKDDSQAPPIYQFYLAARGRHMEVQGTGS